jgi:hypothetical protein
VTPECSRCDDTGWVCENNPDDLGWVDMCATAAPLARPAPSCNRAEGHEVPRLPFTPDDEIKRH